MQFHLRTLLIVMALGPPVVAGVWFARLDVLMLLELCSNALVKVMLP